MELIYRKSYVIVAKVSTGAYRFLHELETSAQFYVTTKEHHVFRVRPCRVGVAMSGFYFTLDSECDDSRKAVLELLSDLREILAVYGEE